MHPFGTMAGVIRVKNCAKMQKIPKNSKLLKNDGHFQIPHPQISLKQFSNICKNVVIFANVGGWIND